MPDGILFNEEITKNEMLLLLTLVERESSLFKKEGELFYCYQEALMKAIKVTRPTLISCTKKLKDLGYINIEKKNHRIYYSLNWSKIEEAGEKFKFPSISKSAQETVEENEEVVQEPVVEPTDAPVETERTVEPTISQETVDCTPEKKEAVISPEINPDDLPQFYTPEYISVMEDLEKTLHPSSAMMAMLTNIFRRRRPGVNPLTKEQVTEVSLAPRQMAEERVKKNNVKGADGIIDYVYGCRTVAS